MWLPLLHPTGNAGSEVVLALMCLAFNAPLFKTKALTLIATEGVDCRQLTLSPVPRNCKGAALPPRGQPTSCDLLGQRQKPAPIAFIGDISEGRPLSRAPCGVSEGL